MHPTLVGPVVATHLKIKESPLLCVMDHSSGHTEEWENFARRARRANVLSKI